tara:strand:- start:149 stop:445 length:297 start_codon:yes stop_codon:yes gene_type:complete
MKKTISIIILVLLVAAVAVVAANVFAPEDTGNNQGNETAQVQCEAAGGTYVAVANECEGVSAEMCADLEGTFNECASACRNDADAEICTMQCVQVCQL